MMELRRTHIFGSPCEYTDKDYDTTWTTKLLRRAGQDTSSPAILAVFRGAKVYRIEAFQIQTVIAVRAYNRQLDHRYRVDVADACNVLLEII